VTTHLLTRRRFAYLSVAGVLGAGGYGLQRAVRRTREAAARSVSQ
jgi:hypothetical protein